MTHLITKKENKYFVDMIASSNNIYSRLMNFSFDVKSNFRLKQNTSFIDINNA